jgi:hypothetical protein
MFDIGDVMLRGGGNRQLNIPPASVVPLPLFPSILTNQASHISVGKHILLETVHVMLDPPDILYRGVRFAPVWVHSASEGDEGWNVGPRENDFKPTVTLRQYYDSLGSGSSEAMAGHMNAGEAELMPLGISHIETELFDTSSKALLWGTVTLANGWAFRNPNGGSLSLVIETLFESSQRMDSGTCDDIWIDGQTRTPTANDSRSNVHGFSPEQVMNDKEPFKDTYQKDLLGALVDRALQRAVDEKLLHQNEDGWLLSFPMYRNRTSVVDTFRTLLEMEMSSGGKKQRGAAAKPEGGKQRAFSDVFESGPGSKAKKSHGQVKMHKRSSMVRATTQSNNPDDEEKEDNLDLKQLHISMAKRLGLVDAAGYLTSRARVTNAATGVS